MHAMSAPNPVPDSFRELEELTLRVVVMKLALQARISLERELAALEETVGELPAVRAQLDRLFESYHTPTLPAAPPPPALEAPQEVRRGVGRPRKERPDPPKPDGQGGS